MAGEEDVLLRDASPDLGSNYGTSLPTRNFACQTPGHWADKRPAQKENEPTPESPPARLVVFRPGMQRPNPRLPRPCAI